MFPLFTDLFFSRLLIFWLWNTEMSMSDLILGIVFFWCPIDFDFVNLGRIPRPFACGRCGVRYQQRNRLMQHLTIGCGPTLTCPHCPYKSHRVDRLRRHVLCHAEDDGTVQKCRFCSYMTKSKSHYRRHVAKQHLESAEWEIFHFLLLTVSPDQIRNTETSIINICFQSFPYRDRLIFNLIEAFCWFRNVRPFCLWEMWK